MNWEMIGVVFGVLGIGGSFVNYLMASRFQVTEANAKLELQKYMMENKEAIMKIEIEMLKLRSEVIDVSDKKFMSVGVADILIKNGDDRQKMSLARLDNIDLMLKHADETKHNMLDEIKDQKRSILDICRRLERIEAANGKTNMILNRRMTKLEDDDTDRRNLKAE